MMSPACLLEPDMLNRKWRSLATTKCLDSTMELQDIPSRPPEAATVQAIATMFAPVWFVFEAGP